MEAERMNFTSFGKGIETRKKHSEGDNLKEKAGPAQ